MSFASDVKKQLSRLDIKKGCCAASEMAAIICFAAESAGGKIKIKTESESAAERAKSLLKQGFDIEAAFKKPQKEGGRFTVSVTEKDSEEFLDRIGLDKSGEEYIPRQSVTEKDCCRAAFVRGAFLGAGSVLEPAKGYHMEFVTKSGPLADRLCEILAVLDFGAKLIVRKNYFVVYLKESEAIAELLGLMGAGASMMDFLNVKIEREIRGHINRQVNCDSANLEKTVGAAEKHLEAIKIIEQTVGLDSLSPALLEMAVARKQNPEATISELAALLPCPIGKSGANHRLKKLMEIAENLK